MAASEGKLSAGDYISHHLGHLQSSKQKDIIDFSVVNFDSIFWSVAMGVLGCFVLWLVARRVTSGVPGRLQAAVEVLVEMVDNQAKGIIHNAESRKLVAPLALTVFVWVFLMNSMDFLPVDLADRVIHWLGFEKTLPYMRVVPTADLSSTLGLSVSVLLICLYYNVKIKGAGGWAHELVSAPFGSSKNPVFAVLLGVANFAMQMIEFIAKTVSHGMRLFGNMYAGELVFMLIALMGGALAMSLPGVLLPIGHVLAGSIWAIFHIMIVALQAFIFMMLTLVYVGQAHDAH